MPSTISSSNAHERLHPKIQRWIAEQHGWTTLRPAQSAAVDPVLEGRDDVIITAPTAGGKTEAAFFPICSRLVHDRDNGGTGAGIEAVYVSPLKALINDQYDRLELLCANLDIPVHRWHGDVPASAKARVRRSPEGIVIITPESFEAMFVTTGHDVPRVLAGLRYVVVDELHAFLGTERGAQLQSLLHRAELAVGHRVPRVALSATLADLTAAREFLRPGGGGDVVTVSPPADASMRLRVFGHERRSPDTAGDPEGDSEETSSSSDVVEISQRLFRGLRGRDHLVFANARSSVETYADRLSMLSEEHRVPNEFFAHHGNLSKGEREFVEERLKGQTPTTAVCTSTLEMGIDVGSVESVVQLGPPPGVASLRQRLGRSGRQNGRPALTLHIAENELDANSSPLDELRVDLVQTVAMIELMGQKFLEAPDPAHPHLSTLIQQILSVIAQRGGASAATLYTDLCGRGPFRTVSQSMFADLLRSMGGHDLLVQAGDGLLLAGARGDRMINHYSFYTAFHTPEEYRVVHGTRTLGTLPVDRALQINALILFGGRRWRITDIDTESKVISLSPTSGARPPKYGGSGPLVADEIRQRMRGLYLDDHTPPWIDDRAAAMLAQGRAAFARYDLAKTAMIERGKDTLLLPWRGDKILNTIGVVLRAEGARVGHEKAALHVSDLSPAELSSLCRSITTSPAPGALRLAEHVPVKQLDKHDRFVTEPLLAHSYSARYLDVPSTWYALRQIARQTASAVAARTPRDEASMPARPPFAVVDVETTGIDADGHDRIVEIAVVQLDPDGTTTGRWTTLVQPNRPPGPTRLHGITAEHLRHAPTFADIADDLLARLSDRVLVAHNADFDARFIRAELARADRATPMWPILCTRRLAYALSSATGRRLSELCEAEGILHSQQHSALGDADATAKLLAVYLHRADASRRRDPSGLGIEPRRLPPPLPQPAQPARLLPRHEPTRATHVEFAEATGDPRLDAYLDLLEIVMADHVVTAEEEQQLRDLAMRSGLNEKEVDACRRRYDVVKLS